MTIRNIKNVTHDMRPIILSLKDRVSMLQGVQSSSDYIKLMKAMHGDVLLLEKYLSALDKEAASVSLKKPLSKN